MDLHYTLHGVSAFTGSSGSFVPANILQNNVRFSSVLSLKTTHNKLTYVENPQGNVGPTGIVGFGIPGKGVYFSKECWRLEIDFWHGTRTLSEFLEN